MPIPSLHRSKSALANPSTQLEHLNNGSIAEGVLASFDQQLKRHGMHPLNPSKLEVLQVNLGYMCNQTCTHCHVDAGPDRKEVMTRSTMEHILSVLQTHPIGTLDLTGGAPEMNPDFRWFVERARPLVNELIVRSNLTIFSANKRFADLPEFFAKHKVRVVSSLPCYTAENTDRQRGSGVFVRSIDALKQLNRVGYGNPETGLVLDLVYNPQGLGLPGPQAALQEDYKHILKRDHDLVFNQLFCITNLPIARFLDQLLRNEQLEHYMHKLVDAFNPSALDALMCRNTLSVGWDGRLYDCDFNQMLDLKVDVADRTHIMHYEPSTFLNRQIKTNQHCYGCTAGQGSSCQGTLV